MVPLILPQTPQKHCDLWKGTVRRRAVDAWEPALPLILAAWHDTPAMLKMVRLAEHLQWAAKHNALSEVADFLRGLREDEWHHLSE